MAKAGAPSARAKVAQALTDDERKELETARKYIAARNELMGEVWRLDRMVGVRNLVLQRFGDQLTDEERALLREGS